MTPNPHDFRSIVVLTGAGVSAESGVPTFRDSGALWEDHRVEEVASPEGFRRDPALVHRFYNARRRQLLSEVAPNAAHHALAEFERLRPGVLTLVTQNVDDLHQRAGSRNVLTMHGELLKMHCRESGREFACRDDLGVDTPCECCGVRGTLLPHIVWFGETPYLMCEVQAALRRCDLFVAVGTSGTVYPAAGFVETAKSRGATTVELNLERSAVSDLFDFNAFGPATRVVPAFFAPTSTT